MASTERLEVLINSNLTTVWECWTKPEHIVNWNFASDDWCCPHASNDLFPGGKFSWRMEAIDGSIGFDFEGEFIEVVENELISEKLADGRLVSIRFDEVENGVLMFEQFESEDQNPIDMQIAGWLAILNNFKKYVESK